MTRWKAYIVLFRWLQADFQIWLRTLRKLEKKTLKNAHFLTVFNLKFSNSLFSLLIFRKIQTLKNLLQTIERGLFKLSNEPFGTIIGHHLTDLRFENFKLKNR